MFTGIIQALGKITHITALCQAVHSDKPSENNAGLQLTVHSGSEFMHAVALGDSIAIQGACMTVTSLLADGFTVDVSQESLSKTTGLQSLGAVNLEKALNLSAPLGGHLVTGHVDGLGTVLSVLAIGESWQLRIAVAPDLAHFFALKGSAVINGVSLTINDVVDTSDACQLDFNLIPHTWEHTTLSELSAGCAVNVEVDLIARYMARMIKPMLQNLVLNRSVA